MMRAAALSLLLLTGCATAGSSPPPTPATRAQAEAEIGRVLDDLHLLAEKGDFSRYFALYTPDAFFVGTDVTERWTMDQFRAYAAPIFARGRGWSFQPRTRRIVLGPDGRTAWFDEILDSRSYGTSQGTGVLLRTPQGWKIAHYALTFPIPNDLTKEFTDKIRAYEAQAASK